jgi:hypothetical protein
MQGQSIVFLLLVTPIITLPVGFAFFRPDPALRAWAKQDKILKKQGIPKKQRPAAPTRDPAYPTKLQMGVSLLQEFKDAHPDIQIHAVLADAAYSSADFMDRASATMGGVQVVSELRCNQKVRSSNGKILPLTKRFSCNGVPTPLTIRGGDTQMAVIDSARLHVCSHGKKRFVIALRYEGEKDYRYLVASQMSWRTQDIVSIWTLRWLIEVFFEDWKANEGWGALTKQQGKEGSSRGLILSILADHCLLSHPRQLAQIKHKNPAYTVGSLTNHVKAEALSATIECLTTSEDPQKHFEALADVLRKQFSLKPSQKHMVGRTLGRQEPTPALRYKAQESLAA